MAHELISPSLPEEFLRRIESDLNKIAEAIPDYFSKIYDEIQMYFHYPNIPEFLVGWCVGACHSSYVQTYLQVYGQVPTDEQVKEIRKIISRRKAQFEQGVLAFLEEKD